MAREVGLPHDPAIELGQLRVRLGDHDRLEPAGADGREHVLDERPAGERDDRLVAPEAAPPPAGEDDRGSHVGIVVG